MKKQNVGAVAATAVITAALALLPMASATAVTTANYKNCTPQAQQALVSQRATQLHTSEWRNSASGGWYQRTSAPANGWIFHESNASAAYYWSTTTAASWTNFSATCTDW